MWFFGWLNEVFLNSDALVGVGIGFGVAILFATAVGFFTRRRDTFLAILLILVGCGAVALTALGIKGEAKTVAWSILFIAGGIGYLLLLAMLALLERAKIRRERRAEILRKLQYTLPDRDNSYVQARLNTALNCAAVEKERDCTASTKEGEEEDIRLEHVRKLLAKVKDAPLTKAERIEAEEMTRLFAAYLKKTKWTSSDVRLINEMFSCLLKMSAKYSV